MDVTYEQAQPQDSRAIIGIAGPNGSGKTASALRLAAGITAQTGGDIYYIDTENKRALSYSSIESNPPHSFAFKHFDFQPPFTAERYFEALQKTDAMAKQGSVIIIDSMSHEHEGVGGLLERQELYLDEKAGKDLWKRDKMLMASLIQPKMARTKFIQSGLQRTNSYIILCFRAKDKIKPVKTDYIDQNGQKKQKTEIVDRGIQIIGGEEYGYEVNVMFVLPVGCQGHPDWKAGAARINDMKGDLIASLQAIPQISEEMGRRIVEKFSVPVDDAEVLREAAKKGTDALGKAWKSLGGTRQKKLGEAFIADMKAVAAKHDAANSALSSTAGSATGSPPAI